MSEATKYRKWRRGQAVSMALLPLILVAVLSGCRRSWIEPLPGIRVEPSRPIVKRSDLGPESAYRLLLQAIADPVGEEFPRGDPEIWGLGGWSNADLKLTAHGWPAKPPPPATAMVTKGSTEPSQWPSLQKNSNPALAPEAPWTLEQYRDAQRLLKLYEPRIALLDRALAAPNPQVPTANLATFSSPHLPGVRSMARWLSFSAQYKAATGDYSGSFQDLARATRMGNTVARGATLIGHLVGIACQAIATHAAHGIATRENVPAPVLKRAAKDVLASLDDADPFVEAIRVEAYSAEKTTRWLFRTGTRRRLKHVLSISRNPRGVLARLAGSNARATPHNVRAAFQHVVAVAEKPYSMSAKAGYERFAETFRSPRNSLTIKDPLGYILASMFLPDMGQAHRKDAHGGTQLGAMALFLAVKAYEKERGALPERLAQLVPDYLPRMPKDPFGGKPFHYLRSNIPGLPPEAWAVYSIGEDFTDDGGKAQGMLPDGARLASPDLVWPSQPYPRGAPGEPQMETKHD